MQEESRQRFDGRLTKAHREKLAWLKNEGALTYEDMGRLVGCNTTTMRNWMLGTQKQCQAHFVLAMRILLSGALDSLIASARSSQLPVTWQAYSFAAEAQESYRSSATDSASEK